MIIPHTSYLESALHDLETPVWLQEAWPGTKDSQTRVNPSAHHKENVPRKSQRQQSHRILLSSKGSSCLHGKGWVLV